MKVVFKRRLLFYGKALIFLVLGLSFLFIYIYRNNIHNNISKKIYSLAKYTGFTCDEILVSGRKFTKFTHIQETLRPLLEIPLTHIDLNALHTKLIELPWVDTVMIKKQWPHSLFVDINEHIPLALWQYKKKLHLISQTGQLIPVSSTENFTYLPHIVGEGAPKAAAEFLQLLKQYPTLLFSSLCRIGERRWNMHMKNGHTILLPETHVKKALDTLTTLYQYQINILGTRKTIDIRQPETIVIR